jgi:diketogulonate reductase-like aldo/keto reductase
MECRLFGATQCEIGVIGQGTREIECEKHASAISALRLGLDLGVTYIDAAEMYGSGEAEEMAPRATAGRRDEVFLVSKVLPGNASRSGTALACERPLMRRQRDGKILSWGVSNFDVPELEELWNLAWQLVSSGRVVCDQASYHLGRRGTEHTVIPWGESHGIAVVAYDPFGYRPFPGPATPGGRVLRHIAAAYNAIPRQVALRFLVRHPFLFALPKDSRGELAAENAKAGELRLSDEELAWIDEAFPGPVHVAPVPTGSLCRTPNGSRLTSRP